MEKRVNDFAPHDNILRVRLVGHASAERCKSDAFIITYNDRVWLVDGGMRGNLDSYERLLELRQAWLGDRRHAAEDEKYKLHITWLVSHFHLDHVQTTVAHTLKSPYIALDEAVIPPVTELPPEYPMNDDAYFRPMTEEVIAKYQPGAGITVVDAGRTGIDRRTYGELSLDILPPECDWGTPENIGFMAELYSGGLRDDKRASITVINSNCIWFVFRFAGRSILLTGDTMKRYPDRADEPYDRMHQLYSEIIGSHVDIVKWVHHGIARDEAAACVHALSPEYIVITTAERETASEKFAADYPDNECTVVRVGAADELFRIMSDGSVTEDTGVDIFADIRGEG